jgi:NADH-quinone oxidoreductase subunit K
MNDAYVMTTSALTGEGPVGLQMYLVVGAILFALGVAACATRRNAIGILIGIELILNAAMLNFMAFWHYAGGASTDTAMQGPVMVLFLMILAASEAAVALAIMLNLYFNFGTVDVDKVHTLRN